MLVYWQLDPSGNIKMKLESIYFKLYSRECILKYRQEDANHFA